MNFDIEQLKRDNGRCLYDGKPAYAHVMPSGRFAMEQVDRNGFPGPVSWIEEDATMLHNLPRKHRVQLWRLQRWLRLSHSQMIPLGIGPVFFQLLFQSGSASAPKWMRSVIAPAPPLSLRLLSLTASTMGEVEEVKQLQSDHDAIVRLSVRCIITQTEKHRAQDRLMKRIVRHIEKEAKK